MMVVGHGLVGANSRLAALDRLGALVQGESFDAGSRRRRLLEYQGQGEGAENPRKEWENLLADAYSFCDSWNHTSSPCKELVGMLLMFPSRYADPNRTDAGKGAGVVDLVELRRCIKWRKVMQLS
jgi:hypothetical protein